MACILISNWQLLFIRDYESVNFFFVLHVAARSRRLFLCGNVLHNFGVHLSTRSGASVRPV